MDEIKVTEIDGVPVFLQGDTFVAKLPGTTEEIEGKTLNAVIKKLRPVVDNTPKFTKGVKLLLSSYTGEEPTLVEITGVSTRGYSYRGQEVWIQYADGDRRKISIDRFWRNDEAMLKERTQLLAKQRELSNQLSELIKKLAYTQDEVKEMLGINQKGEDKK